MVLAVAGRKAHACGQRPASCPARHGGLRRRVRPLPGQPSTLLMDTSVAMSFRICSLFAATNASIFWFKASCIFDSSFLRLYSRHAVVILAHFAMENQPSQALTRQLSQRGQPFRPPPVAEAGRNCWGRGQQDASESEQTLGAATRVQRAHWRAGQAHAKQKSLLLRETTVPRGLGQVTLQTDRSALPKDLRLPDP